MQDMTTSTNYSRSPIVEAIIAFQVELPEEVKLSDLERCQAREYPGKQVVTGAGELGTEVSTEGPGKPRGFLFTSTDNRQIVQARRDGFMMHRLRPYQGWEPMRDEAQRLWGIYRTATNPRKVTRVAVRFLYRVDLPLPFVEMKNYLRTFPQVSSELLPEPERFFMQLNIQQKDIKSTLLLRETVVPPATQGMVSVVLDIDLFRSDEIPPDECGIWALVDTLHSRKNHIFDTCITNRTREEIQ
jgi:uncharacterized protein (TIGR04255 family)